MLYCLWVRTPPDWIWREELTHRLERCRQFAEAIGKYEEADCIVLPTNEYPLLLVPVVLRITVEHIEGMHVLIAWDRTGQVLRGEVDDSTWRAAGREYVLKLFQKRVRKQVGERCRFTVENLRGR